VRVCVCVREREKKRIKNVDACCGWSSLWSRKSSIFSLLF
jgi:hypothetical protein